MLVDQNNNKIPFMLEEEPERKKFKEKTFCHLNEFLKKNKIKLLLRRSIHELNQYSCEILNGWIKKDNFFLNVYGVGYTEILAINALIKQISGRVIIFNVDNLEKKKIVKVPTIYFLKEKRND